MRTGIAVAGCANLDILKAIDVYPDPGRLASIQRIENATGGAVSNVLMDLAALDARLPLSAIAVLGADEKGEAVLERLRAAAPGADFSRIRRAGEGSFTDVMAHGSLRTFFHFRGANSLLGYDDFALDTLNARLLYVGYPLLLDGLDASDPDCGTVLARVLRDAGERGMETCVDLVSEQGDRFGRVVPPALRYTDHLIINEVEAQALTGLALVKADGALDMPMIRKALLTIRRLGVRRWIVIHAPQGAFGLDEDEAFYPIPGALLPPGFIKGSVGAGDAFLAGLLVGRYRGLPLAEAMEGGIAAAVASLRAPGASQSVPSFEEALTLLRGLPRVTLS